MNLLTLRAQARLKSGVDTNDYSNDNLDIQLNQAYLDMAAILVNINEDFFEEQNVKFNLGLNSALYSLPTDCLKLKQVRLAYTTPSNPEDYKIATAYDPTEVHNIQVDEENISTANPIVDLTNNYFRIKPTPTSAITSGGILYYIARPSALTLTGDTPVIPTEYHDAIAEKGAREICLKYGKWNKFKTLDGLWLRTIENLKTQLADRELNRPLRFKSPFEVDAPHNRGTITELGN